MGLSVNVCCISSNSIDPEEEWVPDPVPSYYDMDAKLLTAPTLLDWVSDVDDDDDDEVERVQPTPPHETAEESLLAEESTTKLLLATGGEESRTLIAAGMEDDVSEYDYHHEETIKHYGEDYSLEDYFETIALSHPG